MGNASPIEIAWLLVAVVGGAFHAWAVVDAVLDRRAVDGDPDAADAERIAAASAIWFQSLLAFTQAAAFLLGAMAAAIPTRDDEFSWFAAVFSAVLISSQVAVVAAGVIARVTRRRVRAAIRAAWRRGEGGDGTLP